MKILRIVRRILALIVAICTLALTVFYLFFATVSYEGATASAAQGQPTVSATTSGQIRWVSQAEPIAISFMAVFSFLLIATSVALWRGVLAIASSISIIMLVFTFLTGFSIGGLYFPVSVAAFLGMLLLAIEKLPSRRNRSPS